MFIETHFFQIQDSRYVVKVLNMPSHIFVYIVTNGFLNQFDLELNFRNINKGIILNVKVRKNVKIAYLLHRSLSKGNSSPLHGL